MIALQTTYQSLKNNNSRNNILLLDEGRILYLTMKEIWEYENGLNWKEKPLSTTGVAKKLSFYWREFKEKWKSSSQFKEGG